jgi:hypothetical protein
MFNPEFTLEIARQHQQQLVSEARAHRAAKPVASAAVAPKRARRPFLAWLAVPGRQHAS